MSMYDDIINFHNKFGIAGTDEPLHRLSPDERNFRVVAMQEELIEFANALNIEDEIDALADLVVFALGTAERMGVIWHPHWEEVMIANNKKEPCKTAERSKRGFKLDLCKPKGWTPPNHTRVIKENYVSDTDGD